LALNVLKSSDLSIMAQGIVGNAYCFSIGDDDHDRRRVSLLTSRRDNEVLVEDVEALLTSALKTKQTRDFFHSVSECVV
jgi:hypothetical protein